ncbi:MAG: hypothetical protein JSS96_03315 [Bacteroidetes bacterium]|nr:hypothetical protein [Bacteroidota bacterium]
MKNMQQSQARDLYLNTGLSQKEIAQYLSVSEKTIYLWIKQQSWDKLKQASLAAPAMIVDNLFSQLVELQNHIASRDKGSRFPTLHEAEITRKLIQCIDKLKLYPSQGACMQMMRGYLDFIGTGNEELHSQTLTYAKEYLQGRAINGFAPYDVSYKARSAQDIRNEIEQHNTLESNPPAEENSISPAPDTTAISGNEEAGTSQEITAGEIISAPEISNISSPENIATEDLQPKTNLPSEIPPPEKTGNFITLNDIKRHREINRILNQMKVDDDKARNNRRPY